MKIAVFGASGRTGILIVYQALDKGHTVTAFSRKASNVTINHEKVSVIEGDVRDYEKVRKAVAGQEAVLVALGMENKPVKTLSGGTANIIRAMKECGVNRLICLSSAGVLGNDTANLLGRISIPLFMKHIFRDKVRQMNLIRKSGLAWVIIRPPALTLAPKTGAYRLTLGKPATPSIPRTDVADFMLKLLHDKSWDGKMPAIASY